MHVHIDILRLSIPTEYSRKKHPPSKLQTFKPLTHSCFEEPRKYSSDHSCPTVRREEIPQDVGSIGLATYLLKQEKDQNLAYLRRDSDIFLRKGYERGERYDE